MAEAALKVRPVRAIAARMVVVDPVPAPVASIAYPGAGLSTARLAKLAEHVVGEAFAFEELFLRGKQRGARRLAHGRTLAMGLVHLVAGRSQEDVAATFKRNRTTASNHMEMIEWLNDCPEHDAFWTVLCQRFERLIELADMPSPRGAWLAALDGLVRAVRNEELEDDEAHNQAKHVIGVFWEERARG